VVRLGRQEVRAVPQAGPEGDLSRQEVRAVLLAVPEGDLSRQVDRALPAARQVLPLRERSPDRPEARVPADRAGPGIWRRSKRLRSTQLSFGREVFPLSAAPRRTPRARCST